MHPGRRSSGGRPRGGGVVRPNTWVRPCTAPPRPAVAPPVAPEAPAALAARASSLPLAAKRQRVDNTPLGRAPGPKSRTWTREQAGQPAAQAIAPPESAPPPAAAAVSPRRVAARRPSVTVPATHWAPPVRAVAPLALVLASRRRAGKPRGGGSSGSQVLRRLRGQQNCDLLYRKSGRHGQQLTRTGVRGGAGGANLTWVAPSKPALRTAAFNAVKRAEEAAAALAAQPVAVAVLGKRKRVVASRPRDGVKSRGGPAAGPGTVRRRVASKPMRLKPLCLAFCRTGRCRKPEGQCQLRHDPETVAICLRWLCGTCHGDGCSLQHKVNRARMPVCTFFMQGRCAAEACPYLHTEVSPDAPVCTAFVQGYCARGATCPMLHALTCPAVAAGKPCPNRAACRLYHKAPAEQPDGGIGNRRAKRPQPRRQVQSARLAQPLHPPDLGDRPAELPSPRMGRSSRRSSLSAAMSPSWREPSP